MSEKVLDMDNMINYIHSRLEELNVELDKSLLDLIFDLEYEYMHENGFIVEGDIY